MAVCFCERVINSADLAAVRRQLVNVVAAQFGSD